MVAQLNRTLTTVSEGAIPSSERLRALRNQVETVTLGVFGGVAAGVSGHALSSLLKDVLRVADGILSAIQQSSQTDGETMDAIAGFAGSIGSLVVAFSSVDGALDAIKTMIVATPLSGPLRMILAAVSNVLHVDPKFGHHAVSVPQGRGIHNTEASLGQAVSAGRTARAHQPLSRTLTPTR